MFWLACWGTRENSFDHVSFFAEFEEKMGFFGVAIVVPWWSQEFLGISKTLQLAHMTQIGCVVNELGKVNWTIDMESDGKLISQRHVELGRREDIHDVYSVFIFYEAAFLISIWLLWDKLEHQVHAQARILIFLQEPVSQWNLNGQHVLAFLDQRYFKSAQMVPHLAIMNHMLIFVLAQVVIIMLNFIKQEAFLSGNWNVGVHLLLKERHKAIHVRELRCNNAWEDSRLADVEFDFKFSDRVLIAWSKRDERLWVIMDLIMIDPLRW
jgi:hypothetical protein